MTQYVGVIRKDMGLYSTPEGGVQLQRNLDGDKNSVKDLEPEAFGQIGVKNQQRYQEKNPQPVGAGATSRVPSAMATRAVEETARRRGVTGQKIGQGIGGAIGVLGGLVSLANAGAAGQDAITGLSQAYQTGEYGVNYAKPRLGNLAGKIGAHTARPVAVTRQKTLDPVTASPTNTPAPTPATTPATSVAVAPRQNLPSDPRQILNTNHAGVKETQREAMTMLGNPHYNAGEFSAVNTTDEQGRNINLPGAGPAINQYDPTAIAADPNRMTTMGTFPVNDAQGRPVHPPALQQQVAVEPTVAQPTIQQDPGTVIGNELGTIQQPLPLPDPTKGPEGAMETIQSSEQTGKTLGNAIKMEKAEFLGRQAAYDDFVKMFVEVKS